MAAWCRQPGGARGRVPAYADGAPSGCAVFASAPRRPVARDAVLHRPRGRCGGDACAARCVRRRRHAHSAVRLVDRASGLLAAIRGGGGAAASLPHAAGAVRCRARRGTPLRHRAGAGDDAAAPHARLFRQAPRRADVARAHRLQPRPADRRRLRAPVQSGRTLRSTRRLAAARRSAALTAQQPTLF